MSNTLDFIQTYVATNMENHNLRKTEFKVKPCGEALILTIETPLLHTWLLLQQFCSLPLQGVINDFPYNSEILVNT